MGAGQAAHQLASEAKDLAGDAVQQARHLAEEQLATGKDRMAEGIGSVAQALRTTADQLRAQNQGGVTEYVAGAADRVESASRYLSTRNLRQVVGDVERFARREPVIFLGGTFAVGLMLGRFLKASTPAPEPSVRGYLPAYGDSSSPYNEGYGRGYDDRFQQGSYGYQSAVHGYGQRDRGASDQAMRQDHGGSSAVARTPGTPYGASGQSGNGGQTAARPGEAQDSGDSVTVRTSQGSSTGTGGTPTASGGATQGGSTQGGSTQGSSTQGGSTQGSGASATPKAPSPAPAASTPPAASPGASSTSASPKTPSTTTASTTGATKPGLGSPDGGSGKV